MNFRSLEGFPGRFGFGSLCSLGRGGPDSYRERVPGVAAVLLPLPELKEYNVIN